jgi:transcription initiation factor TFIIIB Brf1 subunit/transcription initiation factor TFIIB
METNLNTLRLCPKCGSTKNLETNGTTGNSICTKCNCRTIKIPLRVTLESKIDSHPCTFCGAEGEEGDILFENADKVAFKCKKCGTVDAYRIIDDYYDDSNDEPYDGNYSFKEIKKAEKEGTLNIFSAAKYKELAKALKQKEKAPIEQSKKQLYQIAKRVTEPLKKLGIAQSTITNAFSDAQSFIEIKGVITEKQLVSLVAASILMAEDIQIRRRDIPKSFATERNISEIFNVDRKTIRKWKTMLEQKMRPPKWGVWLYRENGSLQSGVIEIPQDIQGVVKLEKPYKSSCCFLGKQDYLIWRIKYVNGSWSDICQSIYESFKKTYWEYKGSLNLP